MTTEQAIKFIQNLIELKTGLNSEQVSRIVEQQLVKQVIQQQRQYVYFDANSLKCCDQYREKQSSDVDQQSSHDSMSDDMYLLVRTHHINQQQVLSQRQLSKAFLLLEADNLTVNLYNILQPIKDSLIDVNSQQLTQNTIELKQNLSKFTEQLKDMDEENQLANIQFIHNIVDVSLSDQQQIIQQLNKSLSQLQQLNQTKLPKFQIQCLPEITADFLSNQWAIKQICISCEKTITFYINFFNRLEQSKIQANKLLQDQQLQQFLKEKALLFGSNDSFNFSLTIAQLESFKLNIAILDQYQPLIDILKVVASSDYYKFDNVTLKEFLVQQIQNNQLNDQVVQIYACIYVSMVKYVLNQLQQDTSKLFIANNQQQINSLKQNITVQQIFSQLKNQFTGKQPVIINNQQNSQIVSIQVPFLQYMDQAPALTRQLLRFIKLFDQLLISKQNELQLDKCIITMSDGIGMVQSQFNHYHTIVKDVKQLDQQLNNEKQVQLIQEGLQLVQYKMNYQEFQMYIQQIENNQNDENNFKYFKQINQDEYLILDNLQFQNKEEQIYGIPRYLSLLGYAILLFKSQFFDQNAIQNQTSNNQLDNNIFQFVNFDNYPYFKEKLDKFDNSISQFILQLKPKSNQLNEILNQYNKISKLEILSQQRKNIAESYNKLSRSLNDLLVDELKQILQQHKINAEDLKQKAQNLFPVIYNQLNQQEQKLVESFAAPLGIFPKHHHNNLAPSANAINFAIATQQKMQQLTKMSQQSSNNQELILLIENIQQFCCQPVEMMTAVSPISLKRKQSLHVLYDRQLIQFTNNQLICNDVFEKRETEDDFLLLKTMVFKGEIQQDIKKHNSYIVYEKLFNAISIYLVPAVSVINVVLKQLTSIKEDKDATTLLQNDEIMQLFDQLVKQMLNQLNDIPQYIVKEINQVKIFSISQLQAQQQQYQPLQFYGFFLEEQSTFQYQTFEINTTQIQKQLMIDELNDYYNQLLKGIKVQFQTFYFKFQQFTQLIQTIDNLLFMLPTCSQNVIKSSVQAIQYNFKKLTELFSTDANNQNIQAHNQIIKQIFKLLLRKVIFFMNILFQKMLKNIKFDLQSYESLVQPIITQFCQQYQSEELTALQSVKEYLTEKNSQYEIQLSFQNNKVVFEPNLYQVNNQLLNIVGFITTMFLKISFDTQDFTYNTCDNKQIFNYLDLLNINFSDQGDIELITMKQVFTTLTEQINSVALQITHNSYNFAEIYENRQILFSQQARIRLQELLKDNLEEWCKQYNLLNENDQQLNSQQFGILIIKYDSDFQQQSNNTLAQLKNNIQQNIAKLLQKEFDQIEIKQNQQDLIVQQFTSNKISGILQATSLSQDIFQLLQTINDVEKHHRQFLLQKQLLEVAKDCLKQKQFEVIYSDCERRDEHLYEWVQSVLKQITLSPDFINLIQQLSIYDADLSQKAQEIINSWSGYLDSISEAQQCQFHLAQNHLAKKQEHIIEIKQKIDQIAPAIQILNAMNLTVQLPKFKCNDLAKPLSNIEQDCIFYKDEVCKTLNEINSKFINKTDQKIYHFSSDDMIAIVRQMQDESKQINKNVQLSKFFTFFERKLKIVLRLSNVLSNLCNTQVFKKQHWKQLGHKISQKLVQEEITLKTVLDVFTENVEADDSILLKQRIRQTEDILSVANGQFVIEKYLQEIELQWSETKFITYNDSKNTMITKWSVYNEQIEEHCSGLIGLSSSPYYSEYQKQAEEWKNRLNQLTEILDTWADTQRRWIYLHSVFTANAAIVSNYLSNIADKLNYANDNFQQVMLGVVEDPIIIKILDIQSFLQRLEQIRKNLEEVQKALGSFLEKQRSRSPRLFFVGDDDLLDIISITSGKSFRNMQKHWRKMYTGIDRVIFEENGDIEEIVGIVSKQNEIIRFNDGDSELIENNGQELAMHALLQHVEQGMIGSMKRSIFEVLQLLRSNTVQDIIQKTIEKYCAQAIVVAFQLQFTHKVDQSKFQKQQLDQIYQWISQIIIFISTAQLQKQSEYCRNILISELTHLKNAIQQIIASTQKEFNWYVQLKFYCEMDTEFKQKTFAVEAKMGDASLNYAFEYHGTDQRIVQTDLTDFCYLIGTQAMHDKMGCAPQGRAGTGKTESTKALAVQLGRPVLVFNTDENFNEAAVGRILIGACEVGSMVCFDEFNRLEENTLSAVCQQLSQIQQGLKENLKQINNFLSNSDKQFIKLHQNTAIFVTMNPGYAGRRELPDTLKALLRDVAMNLPDLYSITEVMLSSNGFVCASLLSRKIVPFFTLASEQMTNQPHYDWGLRAIKAVLNSGGNILKELLEKDSEKERNSTELKAIIGAIIDAVVPKLVQVDIQIFNCLLLDVFPGANLQPVEDELFKEKVIEVINEKNLVLTDIFVTKIMQIFRCQQVNIGVMLVGSTGTSKSEALRVFISAMDRYCAAKYQLQTTDQTNQQQMKHFVRHDVLCPKSFSGKEDLFGSLDQTTREWQDGQFTALLRNYLTEIAESNNQQMKQYFAIFDSYIDPEWVESLNSVLDDNRCLTLPNGERLSVPGNVHLIFEVKDLKNATPATVSRCSMIWFAREILPSKIRFESFLKKVERQGSIKDLPKSKVSLKQNLYSAIYRVATQSWRILAQQLNQECDFIEELTQQLEQHKLLQNEVMTFNESRLITTVVSLLEASVKECQKNIDANYIGIAQKMPQMLQFDSDSEQVQKLDKQIELLDSSQIQYNKISIFLKRRLLLSIAWGFCCAQSNKNRFEISKIIYNYFKQKVPSNLLENLQVVYDDVNNNSNTILQYNLTLDNENWTHNNTKLQKTTINENQVGNSVIPTLDTITYGFLIESWLRCGYPLTLVGPAGSGKSMSLTSALRNMPNFEMVFVSFSSNTTPEYLKKLIIRSCQKVHTSSGIVLQPKQHDQTLVIMCDEINLPAPDQFGCQRAVEFIRSVIETQGFYDPQTKITYQLQRVCFAGTCNPPTDPGRYHMCERFLSHCPVFLCDFPTYDSLNTIYSTFVQAIFVSRAPNLVDKAEIIAKTMVDVYTRVSNTLTVEQQQHYIYSPRELTRWSRGLITGLSQDNQYSIMDLAKLVYHEGLRLFQDRLVLNSEKTWLLQEMNRILAINLQVQESQIKNQDGTPILFSFLNQSNNYEITTLQDIKIGIELKEKAYFDEQSLQNQLTQHIVLFDEVIETLLKIDRVIKQPVGHLLLVGVSGVGKTLISKFASWINNYETYEMSTHKKYTLHDFEELLRKLIIRAGVRDIRITFLFDESNALETTFLEHMNALLASGEVPGLFEGENMAQLLAQARDQIEKLRSEEQTGQKLPEKNVTDDNILNWITRRVQQNLHIVFSMNAPPRQQAQSNLQSTAAASPALFNRCVVVWLGDWNYGSYLQLASQILIKNYNESTYSPLIRQLSNFQITQQQVFQILTENSANLQNDDKLTRAFVLMHSECQIISQLIEEQRPGSIPAQFLDGAGNKLATPRHFVRTISILQRTWERTLKLQKDSFSHVQKGLLVLKETQIEVGKMQDQLNVKTVELNKAKEVADQKLQEMATKKSEAQEKQIVVNKLLEKITTKQAKIRDKRGPIEQELADVQPAVEKAKKAINGIDKKKLDEMKAMVKPPQQIMLGMQAVILLVGDGNDRRDLSWDNIKKVMRKPDFMRSMIEYDAEASVLPASVVKKLMDEYINNPEVTVESVNRASAAAGPMYQWACSVQKYQEIMKKIEPLTNEIKTIEVQTQQLQDQFESANKEIQELTITINDYEKEYKLLLKKQQELDQEKQQTENKLNRAAGLVNSLGSEAQRWEQQTQEYDLKLKNSTGDQLIVSFFQCCSLILSESLRKSLLQKWQYVLDKLEITFTDNMILDEAIFNDVSEKTKWVNQYSLQNDQITLQNMSSLLSLTIQDGQNTKYYMPSPGLLLNIGNIQQFKQFLQKLFGKQALFASALAQDFQQSVERAIRFGQTLIVENCEDYDPLLNECIDYAGDVSNYIGFLSNRKITLAGREIEANPAFRLILIMNSAGTTKTLPPSVISKCLLLNYAITQSSYASFLQQQILEYERPSVGKERLQLQKEERDFSSFLINLEKQLLQTINSTDSKQILEEDAISKVLQKTKAEAVEVQQKRQQSLQLCENLEKASVLYFNIAAYVSDIYFSLQKLQKIRFNAHFTMEFFQFVIYQQIEQICVVENEVANLPENTLLRMQKLASAITQSIYKTVGCALQQNDRTAFALHLISLIHSNSVNSRIMGFQDAELNAFEKDLIFKGLDVTLSKSFDNIPQNFQLICQNNDSFQKIDNQVVQLLRYWQAEITEKPLLDENSIKLENALSSVVLSASLQPLALPEILPKAFNLLVAEDSYNLPFNLKFSEIIEQFKNYKQPYLISVVGPTDPNQIALQVSQNKQVIMFAVGQKDCNINNIKQKLTNVKKETLLIISNIHLAPNKFSEMLLKLLQDNIQQNILLTVVLTTNLSPLVPTSLYSQCIKYNIETPLSLAIQCRKTYQDILEMMKAKNLNNNQLQRLCLLISILHSIITLRSKFIPNGYIQDYNYNISDLEADFRVLISKLADQLHQSVISIEQIPFNAIKQYIQRICYGNKVVFPQDRVILDQCISSIISKEVFSGNKIEEFNIQLPDQQADLEECIKTIDKISDDMEHIGLQPITKKIYYSSQLKQTLGAMAVMEVQDDIKTNEQKDDKQNEVLLQLIENWLEQYLSFEENPSLQNQQCWYSNVINSLLEEKRISDEIYEVILKDLTLTQQYLSKQCIRTNKITSLVNQLLVGAIPKEWKEFVFTSMDKVIDFIKNYNQRRAYIISMIKNLKTDQLFANNQIQLGLLYQPTAMITSLKQVFARKYGIALDELYTNYSFQKQGDQNIELIGVQLMFGAYKDGKITTQNATFNNLNKIFVNFTPDQQISSGVKVPVYVDQTRRVEVFKLDVESDNASQVTIQAVAGVLSM